MSKSKAYHKQIGRYVQGKDTNQARLLQGVFSDDAVLKMLVQSDDVSFPPEVVGQEGIIKTLCSEFNERFEDIRTLCLLDTVLRSNNLMNCRWLVGMTSKETGVLHLGYGEYHWTFEKDYSELSQHQVKKLTIVIDGMILLPQDQLDDKDKIVIVDWLSSCTYPWTISDDVLANMPDIESLAVLKESLITHKV